MKFHHRLHHDLSFLARTALLPIAQALWQEVDNRPVYSYKYKIKGFGNREGYQRVEKPNKEKY